MYNARNKQIEATMIVLFSSVTSGKSGKSTLSLNLYRYLTSYSDKKWSCQYITNNANDCVSDDPLNIVNEKDLVISNVGDDIEIDSAFDFSILDWGGHLDGRVSDLAKAVDLVVIPFDPKGNHEFRQAGQNIDAFSEYTDEILVVINKAEKPESEFSLEALEEAYDYPIVSIPRSKWFDRLALDATDPEKPTHSTIFDLLKNQRGAQLKQIERSILPPILNFCKLVEARNE